MAKHEWKKSKEEFPPKFTHVWGYSTETEDVKLYLFIKEGYWVHHGSYRFDCSKIIKWCHLQKPPIPKDKD